MKTDQDNLSEILERSIEKAYIDFDSKRYSSSHEWTAFHSAIRDFADKILILTFSNPEAESVVAENTQLFKKGFEEGTASCKIPTSRVLSDLSTGEKFLVRPVKLRATEIKTDIIKGNQDDD